MKLAHSQVLAAPVDVVWANFTDLTTVGRCFPGASVTHVDGDDFVGNIKSRLGPLTVWFDGEGALTDREAGHHRARIEATGQERHGLGKANISVVVTLSPAEGHTDERPATRAHLATELVFYGSALNVGQGLVQRASDPLVEQFLERMGHADAATADQGDDENSVDLWRSATDLLGSFTGRRRRRP